ncbi:MAG: TetR/AcrR family transcriptional regulator [Acidimicrobiia bacterium]|nr:TetR/AcrR family transcriptional regulator [Acidimicrobiia bacterium]
MTDRPASSAGENEPPADERILDSTLAVLARDGVAGVSVRAVAAEAGVARGLAGYYFTNKTGLVAAALRRIGEQDLDLVRPADHGVEPSVHLRRCLRRAVDPRYLDPDYLRLRLQLWSLAGVDAAYAAINQTAQRRYLRGLADLVAAARPDLDRPEVERRAADMLIVQNGVWLTAVLIEEGDAVERAVIRCEELAFG